MKATTEVVEVHEDHVLVKFPRCKVKGGRGRGFWRCPFHVEAKGMCLRHYAQQLRGKDLAKPTDYDEIMEKAK